MKLNILLICNKPEVGNDANTIIDHIEAFEQYSQHRIFIFSNMGKIYKKIDFNYFDVVIIHYSICLLNNNYIAKSSKDRIRNFNGLKVAFIQDEYRQINKMRSELKHLKIDTIFTCFPDEEKDRIYPKDILPDVSNYTNLTGYVPERLLKIKDQPPISQRTIHVGYRGRRLPYWFGELGYEKWNIVEQWKKHVDSKLLHYDVSYREKDRIYGKKWPAFLSNCKTTLGVESGASIMDFTGELEKQVELYQLTHPNASFHKVRELFFKDEEYKYKLNQISPRFFEAIALKTGLVLYEGEYSGILKPDVHYINLKKDFSNIDEVIAKIKDDDFLQEMVDRAYQDIALDPKYSYKNFIHYVDEKLVYEFQTRNHVQVITDYSYQQFKIDASYVPLHNKIYKLLCKFYLNLPFSARVVIKSILKPGFALQSFKKQFYKLTRTQ